MSLANYVPGHGKYFETNDRDLPESGLFDVQQLAPEIRALAFNPGNLINLIAGTPTSLMTYNPLRRWAWVINNSATENVFVVFGQVGSVNGANGGVLFPGGTVIFGLQTDLPYTGFVSAFSVGASSVSIAEG